MAGNAPDAQTAASTIIDVSGLKLKYMTTTLVRMKAAVVAFPSIDGLKVRGPIARLTIATTARITTSRLITTTVSHSGRWFVSGIAGKVRTMKVVTRRSLSAIGSSQAPRLGRWPARLAIRP